MKIAYLEYKAMSDSIGLSDLFLGYSLSKVEDFTSLATDLREEVNAYGYLSHPDSTGSLDAMITSGNKTEEDILFTNNKLKTLINSLVATLQKLVTASDGSVDDYLGNGGIKVSSAFASISARVGYTIDSSHIEP